MTHFLAASVAGLASLIACWVARSAANRQVRRLALSVGLLAACQSGIAAHLMFEGSGKGNEAAERFFLLSAALLALAVVHFLHRENRDRRQLEVQMRFCEVDRPFNGQQLDKKDEAAAGGVQDRRRSRRIRFHCVARVRNTATARPPGAAEVVDISRTGLGIIGTEPASVGDVVEVAMLGLMLRGVVVRCRRSAAGFSYGVELEPFLQGDELKELLWRGVKGNGAPTIATAGVSESR